MPMRSVKHRDTRIVIGIECRKDLVQSARGLCIHRIAHFGATQGYYGDHTSTVHFYSGIHVKPIK